MPREVQFEGEIESEEETNPVEDADTVSNICELFQQQFKIEMEECVSLKKNFIKYSDSNKDFSRVAIGAGNEMQVYDLTATGLSKYVGKNDFGRFDSLVTGVKFLQDTNLIISSTIAGEIHLYDLRTFKKIHTFEDDSEILVKPVTCFDTNANDRIICAGSEEINNDVYLLFFDIRERRFMGGFVDSHNEEITDVKFHSVNSDMLATGSSDCLINIFDCKKESEEDALQFTINTCDTVNKLKWHADDKLSCITDTNDLHLYDIKSQDLLKKYDRSAVTNAIKRKSVIDCHIVDSFNIGSEMMFLATSNYNKGECLRSIKFNETALSPLANLSGNSQIVRSSLYDENRNMYLTFGEKSIITVWTQGEHAPTPSKSANLKEESSIKKKSKKKVTPY